MLASRLLVLALPLCLLACESDDLPAGAQDVVVDEGDESGDTGLVDGGDEDTGEVEDTGDWEDLDASEVRVVFVQNELIGTIFTLEWTSEQPLRVAGRATLAGGRGFDTPFASELATSGIVELRGLPALTDFQAELLFENEAGERGKTAAESLRTGGPPSSLPVISAIAGDSQETVVPGWHLTTVLTDPASTGKEPALLILNEQGEAVWWWMLTGARDNTVAALSLDGEHVIFQDTGSLHRVRFDGTEEEILVPEFPASPHHHFLELPDGTIAFVGIDNITLESGARVSSHALWERSPSGELRHLWSLVDDADVLVPDAAAPDPKSPDPLILGNVNHIIYDAADSTYILGLQSEGTVFALSRDSGELAWWVHPQDPVDGFAFEGGDPWTATHGMELTNDGIVAFVNSTTESDCARVVLADRRMAERSITQTWEYTGSSCHTAPILGDVHQISAEVLAITWSGSAEIEQVDYRGQSLLTLRASFGQVFGFGRFYETLYVGS